MKRHGPSSIKQPKSLSQRRKKIGNRIIWCPCTFTTVACRDPIAYAFVCFLGTSKNQEHHWAFCRGWPKPILFSSSQCHKHQGTGRSEYAEVCVWPHLGAKVGKYEMVWGSRVACNSKTGKPLRHNPLRHQQRHEQFIHQFSIITWCITKPKLSQHSKYSSRWCIPRFIDQTDARRNRSSPFITSQKGDKYLDCSLQILLHLLFAEPGSYCKLFIINPTVFKPFHIQGNIGNGITLFKDVNHAQTCFAYQCHSADTTFATIQGQLHGTEGLHRPDCREWRNAACTMDGELPVPIHTLQHHSTSQPRSAEFPVHRPSEILPESGLKPDMACNVVTTKYILGQQLSQFAQRHITLVVTSLQPPSDSKKLYLHLVFSEIEKPSNISYIRAQGIGKCMQSKVELLIIKI